MLDQILVCNWNTVALLKTYSSQSSVKSMQSVPKGTEKVAGAPRLDCILRSLLFGSGSTFGVIPLDEWKWRTRAARILSRLGDTGRAPQAGRCSVTAEFRCGLLETDSGLSAR